MATFIRRPSGWLAQIRRTGHKSISRTFDTKVEAERWALSVEATMGQGKYVDTREAESTTLIECLNRYGREVTPSKKGASREMIRIGTLKKAPFADKSIAAVRSTDVAAWRDSRLQSGTAGNTVRLDLALLSHLYTIAIKEWGLPVTNPVTNIRKPPVGKPKDERCLPHQEEMILSALDKINPELRIWAIVAVETGMRRGEIYSLRKEWVRGRVAYLPDTKNGTARQVPLSSRAREALSQLPTMLDGRMFPLNLDYVTRQFSEAADAAGFPKITFHVLRHEATSRFFERGLNMMQVAAITGHKTMVMLRRYTHLQGEDLASLLG